MKHYKKLLVGVMLFAMVFATCGSIFAEVVKSTDNQLIIDKPGTYSGTAKVLIVDVAGVVLENFTAETITISEKVGDGDVVLSNVFVTDLEVYGGGNGESSVQLRDTSVSNITSNKENGAVRVVVAAGTMVGSFDSTNTEVEVEKGGIISNITAKDHATVKVTEGATVDSVAVASKTASAQIAGEVKAISVEASGAAVAVAQTGSVEALSVSKDATATSVEIAGAVASVEVKAAETAIKVVENAKVKALKLADTAKASNVEVHGNVANISTAAAATTISVEKSATVTNMKVAETAKETAVTVHGTAKNLSTSAASTKIVVEETATVVAVDVEAAAAQTEVKVNGVVESANVAAAGTKVEVSEKAEVAAVAVAGSASDTSLAVSGKVSTVATEVKISVEITGEVKNVAATDESFVTVAGEGAVKPTVTVVENTTVVVKETIDNSTISSSVDKAIEDNGLAGIPEDTEILVETKPEEDKPAEETKPAETEPAESTGSPSPTTYTV